MKKLFLIVLCMLFFALGGCEILSVPSVAAATTAAATTPPTATPIPTATPTPEPLATTTPDPTPTPTPDPTQVTIMAVGDLLCLNAQLTSARRDGEYRFGYVFDGVKETISSADLAIANLETLVAEGYPYTGPAPTTTHTEIGDDGTEIITVEHGNTRINAPESFLEATINCGFDVLTNANNHLYDHGADGIEKTQQALNDHCVFHTGAYANENEKVPLIVNVKDIRIAIFAYASYTNRNPGSNAFMVDKYNEETVTADMAAAKEAGADYTIVCIHWGKENTHTVCGSQRAKAEFIANAGADIILGSHPHCTQALDVIETDRGNVPVVYSMGNFVSSMPRTINKDGVILRLVLEKEHVTETTSLAAFTYIPTMCTTTSGGNYAVLTADLSSIAQSDIASHLENSRERTIDVLGDTVATPE